jgi:hypothetical protein
MNSLKIFLSFFLLSFVCQFSSAQTFSLGGKIGLAYSNISTPAGISLLSPYLKSYGGWDAGIVTNIAFRKGFSIQPELSYVEKGFKVQEGWNIPVLGVDIPLGTKVITKLRYIEMPVLAKYSFGNEVIKGYVMAGPTFAYAASAAAKTYANFIVDIELKEIAIPLSTINGQRFEVGGMIGIGTSLAVGNSSLFFDARYAQGFTDVSKMPVIDLDIKNHRFGLNAGFLIPLN